MIGTDSQIAKDYYGKDKLYVFNGLCKVPGDGRDAGEEDWEGGGDRPVIQNLFDTFVAVRGSGVPAFRRFASRFSQSWRICVCSSAMPFPVTRENEAEAERDLVNAVVVWKVVQCIGASLNGCIGIVWLV